MPDSQQMDMRTKEEFREEVYTFLDYTDPSERLVALHEIDPSVKHLPIESTEEPEEDEQEAIAGIEVQHNIMGHEDVVTKLLVNADTLQADSEISFLQSASHEVAHFFDMEHTRKFFNWVDKLLTRRFGEREARKFRKVMEKDIEVHNEQYLSDARSELMVFVNDKR